MIIKKNTIFVYDSIHSYIVSATRYYLLACLHRLNISTYPAGEIFGGLEIQR